MDKPTLRRELRALSRERLTDELRLTGSASIISQLRQHPLWQQAQHVALYAALPNEPNLRTLIDEVATTKQVYLPRVLDGETMDFFAFSGWQELEQSGSFGIYEPRLEADGAVDPAMLDLPLWRMTKRATASAVARATTTATSAAAHMPAVSA